MMMPAPTQSASGKMDPGFRRDAGEEGLTVVPGLRVDDGLGAADHKGLVAVEEIGDDLDKRLRPLGADGVSRVIDEDEMAVRLQLFIEMPHLGRDHPVARAKHDKSRRLQLR